MKQILLMIAVVALVGCGHSQKSFFQATLEMAEAGDAEAQMIIGYMYEDGDGVAKDMKEAVKWYRKAAEQGLAEAQIDLGGMYDDGKGVLEDDKEAVKWYRKAAEQGDAAGQYWLATMYDSGEGVKKNDKEASKWFRKAAYQGDASSQFHLGMMFEFGVTGVVRKDYVHAYAWYNIAGSNGHRAAKKEKLKLAKKMTPAQITAAQKISKEETEKSPKLLK